jgi:hypothetical protein
MESHGEKTLLPSSDLLDIATLDSRPLPLG